MKNGLLKWRFNRTLVELKSTADNTVRGPPGSFNRTLVELKCLFRIVFMKPKLF